MMDADSRRKTDWSKCCLCQEDKSNETLISPLSTFQRKQDCAGYTNIAQNVPQFHAINDMPILFSPARLDEGDGIEATLIQNKAMYHNSCRLLFNNTKLERAQKRRKITPSTSGGAGESCGKRQRTSDPPKVQCFICEEDQISNLRRAMTMQLNERLNQCAKTLNHGKLLAKLSAGDVVAQEMKYHPRCLVELYNLERAYLNAVKQEEKGNRRGNESYPVAFSELVIYIMDSKVTNTEATPVVFRLADLAALYKSRLEQLGVDSPDVNSTRLKEQLGRIPDLEAHKKGRDVLLAFKEDVSTVLSDASKYSEAIHLAKAANIIRREMLDHKTKFSKEFTDQSVEEAVPKSLLQFVCSIEHGVDIRSHLTHGVVKSDLAIAQLLQYNCY